MIVLAGGAWERALGELLTSAEARVLLGGISREALRKRVLSGSVLALRDDTDLIAIRAGSSMPPTAPLSGPSRNSTRSSARRPARRTVADLTR
jgi:hypothetical protein